MIKPNTAEKEAEKSKKYILLLPTLRQYSISTQNT